MSFTFPETPHFVTEGLAYAKSAWTNFSNDHKTTAMIISKVAAFATNRFILMGGAAVFVLPIIKYNFYATATLTVTKETLEGKVITEYRSLKDIKAILSNPKFTPQYKKSLLPALGAMVFSIMAYKK